MSDIDDNPFRSPASDIGFPDGKPFELVQSGPMRVDGKFLVVKSGVVLPLFCVKTNTPLAESNLRKKSLTWCPNYVFVFFLFCGLLSILLYFLLRKQCSVTYGLSAEVQRKYRTRLLVKSLIVVALFVALPLTAGFDQAVSTIAIVLFLISVIALLLGNSPLSITNHQKGEFWISGCSSEFLSRIAGQADPLVL
ncbi:MAG: hypothetical protein JWP89_6119 [Schlesneria sp.]|nr:hypothetical protein [Schlesneria sp.]